MGTYIFRIVETNKTSTVFISWNMLEKQFWASLVVFWVILYMGSICCCSFFKQQQRFLGSKTLTTHQNHCFQSLGPSTNAWAYRFHAYKWCHHHISIDFLCSFYVFTFFSSPYSASGGKQQIAFFMLQNEKSFFLLSLQRWDLSHFSRLEIWCRFR